jgi:uncharacterized protein YndB with AHSA1/START domain
MAEYHLLTIWRIEAPLEKVYTAIENSLRWPDWWPSVRKVEQTAAGEADGIGNVRRYAWQGKLPYRVVFDVRATRIEEMVAIEGTAEGDLAGVGRWKFSRQGKLSVVHYEWHVRSERWWMNLVAPVARSIFIRNHAQIMEQGGKALARLLKAPLASQEHIDLMAAAVTPGVAGGRLRQRGRIDPSLALLAGLGAGVIATAVQLVLWWLAAMPVLETLLRDARLTAAMVLGSSVLLQSSTAPWNIVLVATLIHFALSFAYALIPSHLAGRLRTGPALLAGAAYGLGIYVVNMYGFTLLFPWFAVARDWVTLIVHIVFGVTLVAACKLFGQASMSSRVDAA